MCGITQAKSRIEERSVSIGITLKGIFEAIGKRFVEELQMNIRTQTDIRGKKFEASGNEETARAAKKTSSGKRLFSSGKFAEGAFSYEAADNSVRVFVSGGIYPASKNRQQISFAEILEWNNDGSANANPGSRSHPLLFPASEEDVMLMKAWDEAVAVINNAAESDAIRGRLLEDFPQVSSFVIEI